MQDESEFTMWTIIVEEIGHDRAVDTEVLGQGELADNGAVRGCGEDLVAPRTAGEIGHRGVCGLDVGPEEHAQAPSEILCQGVFTAAGFPRAVLAVRDIVHHLIIRARRAEVVL